MPSISWVTSIFSSKEDTVPPHKPGFDIPFTPSTGIPSFHHVNLAGGLLELESHINTASKPGFNCSGSTRIFTVSGATLLSQTNKKKLKLFLFFV